MGRRDGVAVNRWPLCMKRKTVAEYLDMSEESVVKEVSAGRLPAPFRIGGTDHWRKDAIDAAINHLTGGDQVPEYRRRFNERHGEAA